MNIKLTAIIAILATSLLLAGSSTSAFAATSPTTKILSITPIGTLNMHSVIFQVCAGDDVNMRAPEVIVKSLSEVKSVKLNKVIVKDTCTITGTQMSAFDPNNIKIKIIDKTQLNKMVDAAEKKFVRTKLNISDANTELQNLVETLSGNTPTKPAEVRKIHEITAKLVELRKELSDTRSEYYRLLYMLKAA